MGYKCSARKTATVALQASKSVVILPCPPGTTSQTCTATADTSVTLSVETTNFEGPPIYTYSTNGGRITGDGDRVVWDLGSVQPGTYTAAVEVEYRKQTVGDTSEVTVRACADCAPPCSSLTVACSGSTIEGDSAEFTVELGGDHPFAEYRWTARLDNGTDVTDKIQDQGTKTIRIATTGLRSKTISAKVDVRGLGGHCPRTDSCSSTVLPRPSPTP